MSKKVKKISKKVKEINCLDIYKEISVIADISNMINAEQDSASKDSITWSLEDSEYDICYSPNKKTLRVGLLLNRKETVILMGLCFLHDLEYIEALY